jgi:lipid-binding SYLF domain-containing protein
VLHEIIGWSAPSAIGTAGVGAGGQIGVEVTDFVIILNTKDAVKAFSTGNVTLGGALSVAAGPMGRTGEVAGTVNNFAAVYSYSKSKGMHAACICWVWVTLP